MPEDEKKIAKLIKRTVEEQKRIKAIGSALSWSDIIDLPENTIRGKSFSRTHEEIRELYPVYDRFNRLRQSCDPNGLFRNSFVDRVFPDIL